MHLKFRNIKLKFKLEQEPGQSDDSGCSQIHRLRAPLALQHCQQQWITFLLIWVTFSRCLAFIPLASSFSWRASRISMIPVFYTNNIKLLHCSYKNKNMLFNPSTTSNEIFFWAVSDSARIVDFGENKLNKKYSNWKIVDPDHLKAFRSPDLILWGWERSFAGYLFWHIGTRYYPREC